MQGNTESDYLLFIDNKAIAVVEAKREAPLGEDVAQQAEDYVTHPQSWYALWFPPLSEQKRIAKKISELLSMMEYVEG